MVRLRFYLCLNSLQPIELLVMSGHSLVKSWWRLPAAVVIRLHVDLHGNKVWDRYGFVLSLVRQVLVLIYRTLVLNL